MLSFVTPELNPIKKNLSSEKISKKKLKIVNPPIFTEHLRNFLKKNILGQLAGQISENFLQNTILKPVKIFRNQKTWQEF